MYNSYNFLGSFTQKCVIFCVFLQTKIVDIFALQLFWFDNWLCNYKIDSNLYIYRK